MDFDRASIGAEPAFPGGLRMKRALWVMVLMIPVTILVLNGCSRRETPILAREFEVSQRGELPPSLLSEPDMNLSAHPAPIIQPTVESPSASGQTSAALVELADRASILLSGDVD